jgi:hypothetical protein
MREPIERQAIADRERAQGVGENVQAVGQRKQPVEVEIERVAEQRGIRERPARGRALLSASGMG